MIARILDAGAATAIGAGVFMIATGIKPMPSTMIDSLGPGFRDWWALLLLGGCLAAGIGSALRPAHRGDFAGRRSQWATGLEYGGWGALALCCLIYAGASLIRFGPVTGALTVGFSVGLGLLALGRWVPIQIALVRARRAERRRR